MRYCHSSSSANRAWRRPFLLIVALCMLAAWPALAQVAASLPATAATFTPDTPQEVKGGAATLVEHYNPTQRLRLTIGLQHPNIAEERQFLQDLQTVGKKQYHQFLSAEEWNQRFAPSVADEQAVVDWATAQGFTVTQRFANRLLVDVEAPSGTIEKALNVTMNRYQLETKTGTKTFFSNDRDAEIPSNLTGIIHSVAGLNNLHVLHPENKNMKEPAFPDYAPGPAVSAPSSSHQDGNPSKRLSQKGSSGGMIHNYTSGAPYDPQDMYSTAGYSVQALYNQGHCCNPTGNAGGSPPESSIAIATAGSQLFSDMAAFQSTYSYLAYDINEVGIDGESVPCTDTSGATCDGEGTMDMEWSTAMSNSFGSYQDTAHVWMFDGDNAGFGTFEDIWNAMLSGGNARSASTSWGCEEIACYDSSDIATTDGIFAAMVAQGWSITAAAGDQGATAGCGDAIAVQYPASDPYVTGAGGAQLEMTGGPPPTFDWLVAWSGGPDGCGSNDGGGTGGYSAYFGAPSYQSGFPSRGVPDIALNADWYYTPQWMYFSGSGGWNGNGGTSIVAPETVGFFAQENAYLLALGDICGSSGTSACAPMGWANPYLYLAAGGDGPHNPFYDITSGCNNNDVTTFYGLSYYCAGTGWDAVTGWGAYNYLQLAWEINWIHIPGDDFPVVSFSGPAVNQWYNSDLYVSWTISNSAGDGFPVEGIAGFSQEWDGDPGNPTTEAAPCCSGFPSSPYNAFYDGPQYPNGTSGCLDLLGEDCADGIGAVQGWHTVNIRAWGNEGENGGDSTYGPIGYDTIAPTTTASLSGTVVSGNYENSATVTLSATDPGYTASPQTGSGVASTVYQIDGGTVTTYTAPFAVSKDGANTVTFHSTDHAGNVGSTKSISFGVTASTTISLTSNHNPSYKGESVTFTAVVTPAIAGTPTGTVTFKNGATTLGTKTLSGGKATLATTALPKGTDTITATYSGATYFLASGPVSLAQVVKGYETTTTVTSSANPSVYGESVKFTATITSTGTGETGTMTFKNGSVTLGTGTVSGGKATFTTSATALTVSTAGHSITAVYSGDSNFLGSTSAALKQIVDEATTSTTVKSSLNPSTSGQTVTFTATVKEKAASTVTPTGTVNFMDGATKIGSHALAGGVAAFSTSKLASGSHNITAVYVGNADDSTSTSTVLVQKVNP